jgi:adenylate kinase family enzyme
MKPLVVLVSGAPGSGKTTIARAIAAQMRLPHIERDTIFNAVNKTTGEHVDRSTTGIRAYYQLIKEMLALDLSLVTDGTTYEGTSERDIKSNIMNMAHVVNVHVRAKDAKKRFYDREMDRGVRPPEWVEGWMLHLDEIHPLVSEPLELGVTTIDVDATDEYIPSMTEIITVIERDYQVVSQRTKEEIQS